MMVNQCVICGVEMPEGDQVCKDCITRSVVNDSTSRITICGGAGEQVKSIVKALRGLADALETFTEVEG